MTVNESIREEVFNILDNESQGGGYLYDLADFREYSLDEQVRDYLLIITDQILSHPDIKKGLELLEEAKKGNIVRLDEDQMFPNFTVSSTSDSYTRVYMDGCTQTSYETKKQNFKRVKGIEV